MPCDFAMMWPDLLSSSSYLLLAPAGIGSREVQPVACKSNLKWSAVSHSVLSLCTVHACKQSLPSALTAPCEPFGLVSQLRQAFVRKCQKGLAKTPANQLHLSAQTAQPKRQS